MISKDFKFTWHSPCQFKTNKQMKIYFLRNFQENEKFVAKKAEANPIMPEKHEE
jgi:hypothetical protein